MPALRFNRRQWLGVTGGGAVAAWAGPLATRCQTAAPAAAVPFALHPIQGTPVERGTAYGQQFSAGIRDFLNREIYQAFNDQPSTRADMLRYADACGRHVERNLPELHAELTGIAQGAGISSEEAVLITLHEELYHRGALPKVDHCTAVALGPPLSADGHTLVGQTWDWMASVAGLSTLLHWQRSEGPDVLAYAFPGLWVGAGLNSAGLALCWTSADLGNNALGVRVGIPAYVFLANLLYQETLEAVADEARRLTPAGWFTFVMADGAGNLLNIEGSPEKVVVEKYQGSLARVGFGSQEMTGAAGDRPGVLHPRCDKMNAILTGRSGSWDAAALQRVFQDPAQEIGFEGGTIDMMVFDTTARTAWLSRGPSYGVSWQKFGFPEA